MKLLGISGSLQAKSSNLSLLASAASLVPQGVELVIYDGIRHLPAFDPDLEAAGLPGVVVDLIEQLRSCDGVIIASPEYAHGMPGSLKNAFDWLVGSFPLDGKPVAVTCSVPHASRGLLGLAMLTHVLEVIGAQIVGGTSIVRDEHEHASIALLVDDLVDAAREHAASTARATA